MAFSAAALSSEPRAFSIGPVKIEVQTFSMSSSDTSGTVTAKRLSSISECLLLGGNPPQTSAPSISGTSVTLAFADPAAACAGYAAATCNGYVILFGR